MTESFRAAMRQAGLDYPGPIDADGKLHRVKVGDDKERNSWFILFPDPPLAGIFGCWKRGFTQKWRGNHREKFNDTERRQMEARWQRANVSVSGPKRSDTPKRGIKRREFWKRPNPRKATPTLLENL